MGHLKAKQQQHSRLQPGHMAAPPSIYQNTGSAKRRFVGGPGQDQDEDQINGAEEQNYEAVDRRRSAGPSELQATIPGGFASSRDAH